MKRLAAAALLFLPLVGLAEYYIGQRAMRRGDLQTAYREYKSAAENGDVVAARVLGMLLSHDTEIVGGQKLARNLEESVKWYRVGAEKGDTISADLLGARLAVGRGVAVNAEESLRWFRAAGRDVDATLARVNPSYPVADRGEIAAWFLAIHALMKHEVKPLRGRWREGKASLVLHADGPRALVAGDPPAGIRDAFEDYVRHVLEAAPPPPAAVRNRVVFEQEFVFR